MNRRRRIWVTRAEPGATATARRLEELGHEPLIDPVLSVRNLAASVNLDGVGGLAFTSANAVAAFSGLCQVRELPVFAVGAATAKAAREAGYLRVVSADGDVHDLIALIDASRHDLAGGSLLHPCAAAPAGDLVGELGARGVPARRLVVYETAPAPWASRALSRLSELDDILVHSPRAAVELRRMLAEKSVEGVRLIAISQAALAPLKDLPFASAMWARRPDEASMLELLAN